MTGEIWGTSKFIRVSLFFYHMKVLVLDYKGMSTTIVDDLRTLGHEVDYSTRYDRLRTDEKSLSEYQYIFAHHKPAILVNILKDAKGLESQVYLCSSSIKPEDRIDEQIETHGNIHVIVGVLNRARVRNIIGAPTE
jgi:hypothetical protein